MVTIALFLSIIKILLDLFIFIVKKQTQKEIIRVNAEGKSCRYLKKAESEKICTHFLFKRKMKSGICPRQQCNGFDTGDNEDINDFEIINSPIFHSIKKTIDLFPEFAATLLALNEILG